MKTLAEHKNPGLVVDRVLAKLKRIYGDNFIMPDRTSWRRELGGFRLDEIKFALEHSQAHHKIHPPCLITFKHYCRQLDVPPGERVLCKRGESKPQQVSAADLAMEEMRRLTK